MCSSVDGMAVYRRPLFRQGCSGPSPSAMGQLRRMLVRGRGGRQVQDTPGASRQGEGESQDDYDLEDSFIATEEGARLMHRALPVGWVPHGRCGRCGAAERAH
jgi:hypothetical protein